MTELADEELDTLPLYLMLSTSASCISTTSPGFKNPALIEVAKPTPSVSIISESKFHLPNLCACPLEVQPKATTSLGIILPVSKILFVSSTISTCCLNIASGSFQVTLIWLDLNCCFVEVYLKGLLTFALEKVYTGCWYLFCENCTSPSNQYIIPLNVEATSFNTLSASEASLRYKFAVNLGSSPPLPSETNSSQYLAILYNAYLSIWELSIYFPSPYLLFDIKS